MQHLHELCADLGEDVLALVDVHKSARDDLRLASDVPARIDRHDDDHESILGEMLAVAHDDLRHFLRLAIDEHFAVRDAIVAGRAISSFSIDATCPFVITTPCGTPTLFASRA